MHKNEFELLLRGFINYLNRKNKTDQFSYEDRINETSNASNHNVIIKYKGKEVSNLYYDFYKDEDCCYNPRQVSEEFTYLKKQIKLLNIHTMHSEMKRIDEIERVENLYKDLDEKLIDNNFIKDLDNECRVTLPEWTTKLLFDHGYVSMLHKSSRDILIYNSNKDEIQFMYNRNDDETYFIGANNQIKGELIELSNLEEYLDEQS